MQIQLFHATEIDNLPNSPFTITPIISIFFRMIGEVYALFVLTGGIIMFFLSLFSVSGAMYYLPIRDIMPLNLFGSSYGDSGGMVLLMSFGILLSAFLGALLILMSVYLVSELLVVITDIAINVRLLLNLENKKNINTARVPVIPEFKQEPIIQYSSHCPSCNNITKPEDVFCENCGYKLK